MAIARRCALWIVAVLSATPVLAQDQPPAGVAPAVPDDELSSLYSAFCLQAFPDESALSALAGQKGAVVLTPAEVTALLHQDPGHGWQLRTATGHYQITIENPPFHTCAIRRMTPSGVAGVQNYIAAVNAYVSAHNGKLANVPPQKGSLPSGISISIYGSSMSAADGAATDTFGVVLSNYHSHPPANLTDEAAGGVGVEVRFVHQLLAKQ